MRVSASIQMLRRLDPTSPVPTEGGGSLERRQCDMYSLGVVLWEIFSQEPPMGDVRTSHSAMECSCV
jgi:hypothetical protein